MSLSKPRHSGLSKAWDQSAWPWLTRHRCTREIGRPVQDGGISGGLCRRFWGTGAGRRPPAPRLSQRQGEGAEGGERRRPRCRSRRPLYAHAGRGSRGWRGGRGVVFPASPGIWTRIHLSAAGEGAGEEQPADQGWRLLCQPSRAVQDRALRCCCCCCLEAAPKEPSSFQGLASSLSQTLQLGQQEPVGVRDLLDLVCPSRGGAQRRGCLPGGQWRGV